MTKAELVETLSEKYPNQTKAEMGRILETLVETIRETALGGEEVKIGGFGKFAKKDIKARKMSAAMGGGTSSPRTTIKFKSFV